MNFFSKIKAALAGLPVARVITKVNHYISMLTGNVHFTLTPTPAEGQAQVRELDALEGRVMAGDRTAKPLRDQAEKVVKNTVRSWVWQVNTQANGDIAKLESSGFEFVKGREPMPMPKQVKRLGVKNLGQSGEAEMHWSGDAHARIYRPEYRCMNDTTPEWIVIENCFKNRHTLTGLGKAKEYQFRVCAINGTGVGEYSDIATLIIQ